MGKYEPLARYLQRQLLREVPMTFGEVERVLGTSLPPSAYKHRPWWGNDASGGHVHARAWLDAGFHVERIDMSGRKLVFVGATDDRGKGQRVAYDRHPLLGILKGMGTVAPGVDLTQPADPEWGRQDLGDE